MTTIIADTSYGEQASPKLTDAFWKVLNLEQQTKMNNDLKIANIEVVGLDFSHKFSFFQTPPVESIASVSKYAVMDNELEDILNGLGITYLDTELPYIRIAPSIFEAEEYAECLSIIEQLGEKIFDQRETTFKRVHASEYGSSTFTYEDKLPQFVVDLAHVQHFIDQHNSYAVFNSILFKLFNASDAFCLFSRLFDDEVFEGDDIVQSFEMLRYYQKERYGIEGLKNLILSQKPSDECQRILDKTWTVARIFADCVNTSHLMPLSPFITIQQAIEQVHAFAHDSGLIEAWTRYKNGEKIEDICGYELIDAE